VGLFRAAFEAVKKGLSRTRDSIVRQLRSLLTGRQLSEELIDEIEHHLITADVGVALTQEIIGELRTAFRKGEISRGDDVIAFLKSKLKAAWEGVDRRLAIAPKKPTVILVTGINGAGKTTSVAKIAKSLRDEGRSVVLAAADTFRAGAVEQLAIWSQRLGVEIVRGAPGADPAAVVFDALEKAIARGHDVVLIDTAGRLHTQDNLMRQLTKIRDVVRKKVPDGPHEVLLVLDATAGQNAIEQAKKFQQAVEVTGVFLAKLDGTAKGGVVLAIRRQLGIPVKLIGVGETPDDVEPFDPEQFVEAMFAE